MTLFSKVFTTRTLVLIAFVLSAIIVMKGLSARCRPECGWNSVWRILR
jgi:hypothetical protein